MARVKTAVITKKKHKKILKRAKGFFGAKHYRFRTAKQQVMKSGNYAFAGKMLSDLAITDPKAFTEICNVAKANLK